MGYIRHHAIVVTGPTYSGVGPEFRTNIHDVRARVVQLARNDVNVTGVVSGTANSMGSFLVAPDGSKEGWEESRRADAAREEIIRYLDSLAYEDGSTSFDYVEIQFGDDDKETKVITSSDDKYAERRASTR